MEFLYAVSFLFILHMIHVLSKTNPFERNLRHCKYSARKSSLNNYDGTIRFSEGATLDNLHEAIFNVMFQTRPTAWEYRNPTICFENFINWSYIADYFKPFYFSSISFDDVNPDTFQCNDFLALPCEQLFLPRRLTSIEFLGYEIPHIKEIVIRSPNFVSLVPHADYTTAPFKSAVPINISVPWDILAQYRTDPVWSSLRFIDEYGNVNSAIFNGLPPIDPASQPRCFNPLNLASLSSQRYS